ncbi:MAG: response regulator [Pseudomonadota bacterium]
MKDGLTRAPLALVVDDDPLSCKKFSAALKSIDVPSETFTDGASALDRLREGGVDLILLDILMPEMTGFEVLEILRQDDALREVPVLVISGLDQTSDVVQALELGAVDFLPKNVEPMIFRTRVSTSLSRKQMRDKERLYLEDVERLTDAARLLREKGSEPGRMPIASVKERIDSLGTLARVFGELATAVHERETRARRRINLLQGSILLLIMGMAWGVVPALSKILVTPGLNNPIGVAAWVALVTFSCVSVILAATRRRPRFSRQIMVFGLVAGLFAGVLPQTVLFWVSGHLPGIVLSICLALESLFVFAIAATMRLEKPSMVRLIGLLVGLVAVLLVMFTTKEAEGVGAPLWVLAVLLVPLSYAVESILVATMPGTEDRSPVELLWFIMLGSSVWGWSAALLTGAVIDPTAAQTQTILLIAAVGVLSAISNGSYILAIRRMGAVFASQYAYVVTVLGVLWSMILLDERLTLWVLVSLACVLLGIFMVRPKEQPVSLGDILGEDEFSRDTAA